MGLLLTLAPRATISLECDQAGRDRFDRRRSYVWCPVADDVYLVKDAMMRNGWAESETFGPDVRYRDQPNTGEQFSVENGLGVRMLFASCRIPAPGVSGPRPRGHDRARRPRQHAAPP
jgi:hypothetical protein